MKYSTWRQVQNRDLVSTSPAGFAVQYSNLFGLQLLTRIFSSEFKLASRMGIEPWDHKYMGTLESDAHTLSDFS
jgi:hypothetical protein